MAWKFRLEAEKKEKGYIIIPRIVEKPAHPPVTGTWDAPHDEWHRAKQHSLEKLEVSHEDGDKYIVDDVEYDNPKEAIDALKEPS